MGVEVAIDSTVAIYAVQELKSWIGFEVPISSYIQGRSDIAGGGVLRSKTSFFRGVSLKWMESGHRERGGQKVPKMGGRPL